MRNLNLLFNKEYYRKLGTPDLAEDVAKINDQLCAAEFSHDRDYVPLPAATDSFILETAYPGLLVGTGNLHNAEESEKEIAVGFSFDYASGQPYIPGSSVKGVLRNHFKEHPQAIAELAQLDVSHVKALEAEIFENNDIFFDAVVYDSDMYCRVIGRDYITPHPSPTADPIPISLLKVMPGVRLEFRFKLHDSDLMDATKKKALFQSLITLFGIGAKTNVGYGILLEDPSNGAPRPKKALPTAAPEPRSNGKPAAQGKPQYNGPRYGSYPREEKVPCPNCGFSNFKYKKGTTERWTTCYKCRRSIL